MVARLWASAGSTTNYGVRTKDLYQIYIPAHEAGLVNGYRVQTEFPLNLLRNRNQRVVSVKELPGRYPTYCFTEPETHMGVFGNVLTYQCDIGDLCLANSDSISEVIQAGRLLAQALVRVNTMDCMYQAEVKRTNRIGVSLTGIHEFAWRVYRLGFRDLLDEDGKAHDFWCFIEDLRNAVEHAADMEARRVGLPPPATYTCIKPSGTISKVMNCTEGAHLPANRHYIRWTMTTKGSETERQHRERGYPIKDVSHRYSNTVVIGFPMCLPIVNEMPDDKLVTASEATPEEQYTWLQLLERYWLGPDKRNNQVSYTLKWKKSEMTYEQYVQFVLKFQPLVRCCSLMPELEQSESLFGYLPEEPVSREKYGELVAHIDRFKLEVYDGEDLKCEGGICPIEDDIHQVSAGKGDVLEEA